MDLTLFQYNDTATMRVRDPNSFKPLTAEDGTPVTITLSGKDSAAYEAAAEAVFGAASASDEKPDPVMTVSDLMARCTIGWTGITNPATKEPMICDREHARSLYKRLKWLRDQIEAFVSNRRNFMKVSSET